MVGPGGGRIYLIRLMEILPPLGVAEDDPGDAEGCELQGRNLAGVGPAVLEVDVLGRHLDVRAELLADSLEIDVWRSHDNFWREVSGATRRRKEEGETTD